MAKWFQPPRIQRELESSVNLVLLCSGGRNGISSSRNKLAKCTQRLTGNHLVRFPNPHYVVGWGTEPLHRG